MKLLKEWKSDGLECVTVVYENGDIIDMSRQRYDYEKSLPEQLELPLDNPNSV